MNKSAFLFPFVLLGCVVFALENSATAIAIVLAMLIHECGHMLAIKITGGNMLGASVSSVGACISCSGSNLSLRQEILVYIAGPCAGAISAIAGHYLGFELFAWVSFGLSVMNMLPSVPFDGGCILRSVCGGTTKFLVISSVIVGLILCLLGLYSVWSGGNFTVFAAGIGVFVSLVGKSSLQ
ncbi:MAG: hypothetical protein IKT81_01765 [Clostridia bacterium]|nr:hypothetical protein [Clostridia bacterium]MBR4954923.1 hypothetical protein [Clostridia bacterium]